MTEFLLELSLAHVEFNFPSWYELQEHLASLPCRRHSLNPYIPSFTSTHTPPASSPVPFWGFIRMFEVYSTYQNAPAPPAPTHTCALPRSAQVSDLVGFGLGFRV